MSSIHKMDEPGQAPPTGLEAEMRQKQCNFMMTLLLCCDCVLDHWRGDTHFADFGANQS